MSNPPKEASNRAKHGWDFKQVGEVFAGPRMRVPGLIGQRVVRSAFEPVETENGEFAAVAEDPDAAPILSDEEFDLLVALEDARDVQGVARLRRRLGLAQVQFVNRYGIPLSTLRQWEQGVREPDAASRLLLAVVAEDPELVARVAAWMGQRAA